MGWTPKADKGRLVVWDVSLGTSSLAVSGAGSIYANHCQHLVSLFPLPIHKDILGHAPSTERNSQQREEGMSAFY